MGVFKNKKIAIVGLGVEGLSSALYLVGKGAEVTVFDKKEKGIIENDILEKAQKLQVNFVLGEFYCQKSGG